MAVRYFAHFVSSDNNHYRVEILDKEYTGAPSDLVDFGANGFELEYPGNDAERYDPIKGSALNLELLVSSPEHEALIVDIANGLEKQFAIRVYKNQKPWWIGHIACDLIELPDDVRPYPCKLVAKDSVGALDMNWDKLSGTGLALDFESPHEVLLDLLSYTGLQEYWETDQAYLRSSVNWYASAMPEWDTAYRYQARVLADGGTVASLTALSESIEQARSVVLNDSSCYLLQYRDRVLADGGTVVNLMQPLFDNPNSDLLTAGTYDYDAYNPLEQVLFNVFGLSEKFGTSATRSEIQITVIEALRQILRRFGCRLYQADGSWNIDQVYNFTSQTITGHWYYSSGDFMYAVYKEARYITSNSSINRKEGGGLTRFARPLKTVKAVYQTKLDLDLSTIRTGSLVELADVQAGEEWSFGVIVNTFAKRLERLPREEFFRLWFRIELIIENNSDAFAFINGDPTTGPFSAQTNVRNWIPGLGQWSEAGGYYHVMVDAFRREGIHENTSQFQFNTPPLPLSGRVRFKAEYVGYVTHSALVYDLPVAFDIQVVNESLNLLYNGQSGEVSITNEAEADNDNDGVFVIDDLRLGDTGILLSPGALVISPAAETVVATNGWRRDRNEEAVDIGFLLAKEYLTGQRKAIRLMDAAFISADFSPRYRIERSGYAYLFSGLVFNAALDTWSGTWFETAKIPGVITPRVVSHIRDLPYAPQLPQQPAGDIVNQINAGIAVTIQQAVQAQVTTISADIDAGTITSLPIVSINEAFLQQGDKLGIVIVQSGIYYEVTLASTPAGDAGTLSIDPITLPNIPDGSPVIVPGRRAARNIKIKDSGKIAGLAVAAGYIGTGTDKIRINTDEGDVDVERDVKATRDVVASSAVKAGTKVTLDATTGNVDADGDMTATGDVAGTNVTGSTSVKAGTKVTLDAATGNVDADGDMTATGDVAGTNVTGSTSVKAGTKITLDAATGNVDADGDMTATGDVAGTNVTGSTSVKAGTKVTLDAATGNVDADGDMTATGDVAGTNVTGSTSVKAGTKVTLDATTGEVSADGLISGLGVNVSQDVVAEGDIQSGNDIVAAANVKAGTSITLNASAGTIDAEGNISTDANLQAEKDLIVKEKVRFIGLPTTEPTNTGEIWVRTITIGEEAIKVLTIKEA